MLTSTKKRRPLQRHQVSLAGEQLETRQLLDTQGISYASASDGTVNGFESYHDDDGLIKTSVLGPGQYLIVFEGLGSQAHGSHVHVRSADWRAPCNVVNWASNSTDDLEVRVNCYDASGTLARSAYRVAVVEPDNNLGLVYAWAGSPTVASYTAKPFYAYSPSGDVQISRLAVGHYQARFVGQGRSPHTGGNVQITPYGKDPRSAHINYWASDGGDMLVDYSIKTVNGVPADGAASIMVVPFDARPDSAAYGWAKAAGSDEDLISSGYAYNPSGGSIMKRRVGPGFYQVTIEGFQPGLLNFHIATAYGRADRSCHGTTQFGPFTSLRLEVRCTDTSGSPADSAFAIFAAEGNAPMYQLRAEFHSPVSPLGNHEYTVAIELFYASRDHRTANFVVTPMTRGEPSPNAIVLLSPSARVDMLPSPAYVSVLPGPFLSFTISAGTVHVDQLRLEIWSEDNRDLLFSGFIEIDVTFGPSPTVGDFDLNGLIDEDDLRMICEDPSRGDLNRDQKLDLADLDILVRDILATSYGDANLDGSFDTSDLTQIFMAGKYERAAKASWGEGDWNCDGRFDSADLIRALADGAYERRSPIVDLAARRIEANILRSLSPTVADIEVVGYVRNVGTLGYQSNATQQVARLYKINPGGAPRLVASQPFANLAPGQEVAVRYTRRWDRSSPAEGEFPPTYRLVIEFDPDIAFDGNPLNDDRVQPNNATEMSGTRINDLLA